MPPADADGEKRGIKSRERARSELCRASWALQTPTAVRDCGREMLSWGKELEGVGMDTAP
eukprot:1146337-Pelagomonas_calceolata.AAC.2